MELTWKANYQGEDGKLSDEFLAQFNDDGTENKYKDIDRFRLARFDMLNEDKKVVFSLYLRKYQRLIFRRRTFIKVTTNEKVIVYLVGWQQTITTPVGQRNVTSIAYLHEDGSVALDGHRNNLELLPEEDH